MTCATCKFRKEYNPVPKPEMPEVLVKGWPKKRGFWTEFFFGMSKAELEYEKALYEYLRKLRPWQEYQNKIICQRFPERVEKFKTDICGEYSDA
jgi:hypothetical protein